MEVTVQHLQSDPKTGILRYRRVIPARLRPFVAQSTGKPLTEFKVTLRARKITAPLAAAEYDKARQRYELLISHAEKFAAGAYDDLGPKLIAYLADTFVERHLALDEAGRWGDASPDFPFESRSDYENDYIECREMLEDYDADGLLDYWRDWAIAYTLALGYVFDPTSPSFKSLCRALGAASCELWLALDKRIDGIAVATPEPPSPPERDDEAKARAAHATRPTAPASKGPSFDDIVRTLLDKPRLGLKEGTKEHARAALRFLKETLGTPRPEELTKSAVTSFLDLMAQRPSSLPAAEKRLTLPELSKRYEGRNDIPRLSPRTQQIRARTLASLWNHGVKEGDIAEGMTNPFSGHSFDKTSSATKKAKGFTPDELKAYFSLPVFGDGDRPKRGKGDAIYWLPLIALFTGARPEEVAQLLVGDIFQADEAGQWVIQITDAGVHPVKGPQSLKTGKTDSGARVFPVPQPLLDLGLLDYRTALKKKNELAIFPLLRIKNKRGDLFPSFGEWWCGYVYEHGVLMPGTGRKPFRELRDTWATAARASGIPRDAREYIMGHKPPGGGSSNEVYGEHEALGGQIDHLKFKVDILSLVPRWKPSALRSTQESVGRVRDAPRYT